MHRRLIVALLCGPLIWAEARAQDSLAADGLRPGQSLGQPSTWHPYAGVFRVTGGGAGARPTIGVLGGAYRAWGSAVSGALGVSVEPLLTVSPEIHPGMRAMVTSRAIALAAGAQFVQGSQHVEPVLSWYSAIRRGGVLGRGSMLRVDWMPAGADQIAVGLGVPIGGRAGVTRPHVVGVRLPGGTLERLPRDTMPGRSATDSALTVLAETGRALTPYTDGFPSIGAGSLRRSLDRFRMKVRPLRERLMATSSSLGIGGGFGELEARFHATLASAFAAAGGELGASAVTTTARHLMLDEVILPVDALFGQVKEGLRSLSGPRSRAETGFARWLVDSSLVPPARRVAVQAVFRRYGDVVEASYRKQGTAGARSRTNWIPPQFALLASEHDEQGEIDRLVERVTARAFADSNRITYVRSTEVQQEFLRTIRAARAYHVLWLHDFMGRNGTEVDAVGFVMTVDGYLKALTRGVREFDVSGRLPTFIIFLDQHFYDLRDGRLWMTVLENPLQATERVLARDSALSAQLRAQLEELRVAVAGSRRLQAEAARRGRGGEAWLRAVVKVHVSVTHTADFSFRSRHILPDVPLVPDNIMRDHRKLAFYDLREDDPSRGELLIAGAGIGEQYASATWDDRAMLVRGPAALEAKANARNLLRTHGVREADLPPALLESTGTRELTPLGGDPRNVARALQVHNAPGFGPKTSSVARAMLYSLMPAGSLLIVPDPLWLSTEWAGMLVGAAMRGADVYVVAPSVLNAPSAGLPQMSTTYDLLSQLLILTQELSPVLERAGGGLHVGIFTAKEDVNDVRAQIAEVSAGLRRSQMAQTVFPFPASLVAATDSLATKLELPTYAPLAIAEDALLRLPQLHQKTQFMATRAAIDRLVKIPEWRDIFLRVFATRIQQASAMRDSGGAEMAARAYMGVGLAMVEQYRARLDSPNRDVLYLTLGSQNQDPRGMMLDGEATVVTSGVGALVALPDFYYMLARSTWITRPEQLRRFFPKVDSFQRRIGRLIRYAL